MAITKTISLDNWRDAIAGKTGNPLAEQEIVTMAEGEELLVEDDGHLFAPVNHEGKWTLEQVLTEQDIADLLHIPPHETRRLLVEAAVPTCRTRERLFSPQQLWSAADVRRKVEEYTASHGLQSSEAALELGLTLKSYEPLVSNVLFHSNGRVLKVLLEAYRNKFLPRDKIWGTRTSLLKEFVDNFNRTNSTPQLVLQLCDVEDCGHAASAQCTNPQCRDGEPRRFVCPAHEVWVDVRDVRRRPPALCPLCAGNARDGLLPGFPLL